MGTSEHSGFMATEGTHMRYLVHLSRGWVGGLIPTCNIHEAQDKPQNCLEPRNQVQWK